MHTIDLNCDLGEGAGNDEQLMPFITSANIACGYHAGDENTMAATVQLCLQYKVAIGAHPSFPDRANFGRTAMQCTPAEVYQWVQQQIQLLQAIAVKHNTSVHHVKPHGALYNQAAADPSLAMAIAQAVKDSKEQLVLVGLSGSYLVSKAKAIGLTTASEVFADRTYQEDGSLTPRTQPNALVADKESSWQQVSQMIKQGTVTALSGKLVPLQAQTICLHGDGQHAVTFAKTIYEACLQEGIAIKPFHIANH
jgi:UPF0271 protein